jgi:hypothetical protein
MANRSRIQHHTLSATASEKGSARAVSMPAHVFRRWSQSMAPKWFIAVLFLGGLVLEVHARYWAPTKPDSDGVVPKSSIKRSAKVDDRVGRLKLNQQ